MKIECAWCKLDMGQKEPLSDPAVTHTICEACQRQVLAESPIAKVAKHVLIQDRLEQSRLAMFRAGAFPEIKLGEGS